MRRAQTSCCRASHSAISCSMSLRFKGEPEPASSSCREMPRLTHDLQMLIHSYQG